LSDTAFDPTSLATVYPRAVDAVNEWSSVVAPLTGKGIGIAVIDSGIAAHADLDSRILASVNFNPTVSDANDGYGHGTAVSGIIAGNGSAGAGQYIGIAPQANLINLRVNDGTGAAPTSAIMNAILWAVNNRAAYNIRVMNLSLSASVQESYLTSPIDAAVEYAWFKGVAVVVAAGNNGPNSALYAPGNDPFVITVGATDDRGTSTIGDDTLATFSSFGTTQDGFSKPEVVAPGRHIVTTLAANSSFALNYPSYLVGSQYIQLSGTSMAAPMVSGVAALYIESNPTVRPNQLKSLLLATARPLAGIGTGAGYPDAAQAIAYTGLLGNANRGIQPNNFLQLLYMQANNLQSLLTVSWDSVSWDSVSWDSVSWDSIVWDAVSWTD
jgi:serine protease AprX